MIRSRFFRKFFLTTVVLIVFAMTIIMCVVGYFVNDYLINAKRQLMYEYCHSISVVSYNSVFPTINDELSDAIHAMENSNGSYILIVDTYGKPLACGCDDWYTSGSCKHVDNYIPNGIMKVATVEKYESDSEFTEYYDEPCFTCAIPLSKQGGSTFGAVFVTTPYKNIQNMFSEVVKIFGISMIFPLVILFIMEYFISYRFVLPLKLMSDASKCVAAGDFSKRIPVVSKDEIGELALSFNEMTEALVINESTRKNFVANISHELRTPMTSIGGFIDGILDGTIPKSDRAKYLTIASNEVKRLTRLVESMFDIAKLEAGEREINPTSFDIQKMVFDILFSKEKVIESKNIKIEGLDKTSSINIFADYDLIFQVVYNLIDNAIKFNEDNGFIKIDFNVKKNDFYFKIVNSGETIQKDDLPFIFDRFYKGDKARSNVKDSTGLGLYIVKTILELNNGSIAVKINDAQCTEFDFVLKNVIKQ